MTQWKGSEGPFFSWLRDLRIRGLGMPSLKTSHQCLEGKYTYERHPQSWVPVKNTPTNSGLRNQSSCPQAWPLFRGYVGIMLHSQECFLFFGTLYLHWHQHFGFGRWRCGGFYHQPIDDDSMGILKGYPSIHGYLVAKQDLNNFLFGP